MALKVLGSIFIILSCSFCGYSIKYKHSLRVKELENLLTCFDVININIATNLNNIYETLENVLSCSSEINRKIFEYLLSNQKRICDSSFSVLWKEALEKVNLEYNIYEKEDMDALCKFGNMFGTGNYEIQSENIKTLKVAISKLIDKAKDDEKKLNVSAKIGIYAGIVLSVLLV